MKKSTAFLVGLGLLASLCRAEPRWCSVVSNDPSNKLIYPPIARAARVPGVVLVHMIYAPNGKVVRVEPILGPRLLSSSLAQQMMDWTVRTDASGDELCETLVIAKFTMLGTGQAVSEEPGHLSDPSILRLSVETEPLLLDVEIDDPAPLRGFKLFRTEAKWRIKRVVHKIFD